MKKFIAVFTVLLIAGWGGTLLADPVSIQATGVGPGVGYEGVIQVDIDYDATAPFSPSETIGAYCVDPNATIVINTVYNNYYFTPMPDSSGYQVVAAILNVYGTEGVGLTDQEARNVQYAIWTALGFTGYDSDEANAIIADVGTASVGSYMLLQNDINQPLVVRTPEPASILLLGLGLFGVGLAGRKFRL